MGDDFIAHHNALDAAIAKLHHRELLGSVGNTKESDTHATSLNSKAMMGQNSTIQEGTQLSWCQLEVLVGMIAGRLEETLKDLFDESIQAACTKISPRLSPAAVPAKTQELLHEIRTNVEEVNAVLEKQCEGIHHHIRNLTGRMAGLVERETLSGLPQAIQNLADRSASDSRTMKLLQQSVDSLAYTSADCVREDTATCVASKAVAGTKVLLAGIEHNILAAVTAAAGTATSPAAGEPSSSLLRHIDESFASLCKSLADLPRLIAE